MLRFSAKKPNIRRGWVPQPLRRAGKPRPYDFASCFALSFYMSLEVFFAPLQRCAFALLFARYPVFTFSGFLCVSAVK